MSDDLARLVVETHKRAAGFANDMRRQGIHVGLGNPPVCVTCGQPWPCDTETREATDDSIEPPPTKPMTDARLEQIREAIGRYKRFYMPHEMLAEIDYQRGEVARHRRKDETARKVNDLAAKLKVTPYLREGRLLVDATDVLHTGHDIQVWRLEPGDADGREWVCPEAGERGPLTQMLRAIASVYLLAPDGREQRR